MGTRRMGTGQIQPGYEKIKAKQEFFQVLFLPKLTILLPFVSYECVFWNMQVPNGYLVHEKTGGDRVLYYTTAFLTVAGVAMSFKFFYDASFPKKG